MRVDQFVPSLVRHDAISNHVLQVRGALRRAGYESDVFYQWVEPSVAREGAPYQECDPSPAADRVILYHASTDSSMAAWLHSVASKGQRVALDYHNVTPPEYFARWEPQAAASMDRARRELAMLARPTGLALADSEFNRAELVEMGYSRTEVAPILVDLAEYHREPDARTLARLERTKRGGATRWLFVGRFTPNKCQHDLIASFALYRRLFDGGARLTLVGGATSPRYLAALGRMARDLGVEGAVELRDSTPFASLLAYFRAADLFVCLSEHEGFCVPVLEAMELGVPVLAYRSSAVPDTVGSGGALLDGKDPLAVACEAAGILQDEQRRSSLARAGRQRASELSLEASSSRFLSVLAAWLGRAGGDRAR